MIQKRFLLFFIIFSLLNFSKLFAKDTFKEDAVQNIHYSLTGAVGYRSMLYYDGSNTASENFFTLSFLGTYYPLSFLAITGEIGLGFLPLYDTSHLNDTHTADFPSDVTRSSFFTSIQADFFFFANPDNMLYLGIGGEYQYLSSLSDSNSYTGDARDLSDSDSNMGYLKLVIGDRFALFSHVIMDANIAFLIPFTKEPGTGTGNHRYNSFTIMFELGFGYFN